MSEAKLGDILEAGLAHHRAGRFGEAEGCYRRILRMDAGHGNALHMLGLALAAQRRFPEAIAELRRALAVRPNHHKSVYNLARALQDDGQWDEAADTYRQAIALRTGWVAAHNNLGIVLQSKNDLGGAEAAYRTAIGIQPEYAEAHYNLASALKEQNRITEAVASYRQALAIKPDYPEALLNLGNVLQRSGRLDEATEAFRRAIALKSDLAMAHNSLGNAFKDAGRLDEAIDCYRRSIAVGGGSWAWDNLLYTLHFHPDYDAWRIAREHARWNEQVVAPSNKPRSAHGNARSADRRLNVGYVSPDFREHPVGRFMLPLLSHHDGTSYRIHCYSDARFPDALSKTLRAQADVWRETGRTSDDELVRQIREDGIDVLVDLTMHMEGNRLLAFAQAPAPVQVSYLAYCSTTGLGSMNYRLTDPYLDRATIDDKSVYCETSIRLPRTYWCYQPAPRASAIQPPPALANGYVTFGCLNNYSKVTAPTWAAWFGILRAVPNSRLLVQSPAGGHRRQPLEAMAGQGLDPGRLTFVDRVAMDDYLRIYHRIDIALDPFPYGGGTTTCDALWMGVPVVTLAGQTAVSRGGSSILSQVGLADWITRDSQEYIRLVTVRSANLPGLAALRSVIRQKMLASALMDAPAFARDIESAFREMWVKWSLKPVDGDSGLR